MDVQDALQKFKQLQISKDMLCSTIGDDLYNVVIDKPCVVNNNDVMFLLNQFKQGNTSLNQLLEWVNVVWFTDLFVYTNKHSECISSIMPYLEEADEEGGELTVEAIDKYIDCLSNNKPVE